MSVIVSTFAISEPASAVPSFARQTGQPCAACHTAFPELTPFGRRFKLSGYTLGGGDYKGLPTATMIMPTFTHTQAPLDNPPAAGLKTNDNAVVQQATEFVAGKIYGDLGAFIQTTFNPPGSSLALDASDVRYVKQFQIGGADTYLGLDVNNTPTVEDPWNTVDAWSFPEISSTVAGFGAPGTHIDAIAQKVMGAGAYVFWNDMLYANFTVYRGLDSGTLAWMGLSNADVYPTAMPYWRVAAEPHWGDHYLMLGTFGMYGEVMPGGAYGVGTDKYLDVGFDAQYQYDGDQFQFTVKASNVHEWQKFSASQALGNADNLHDEQNNFRINATYVWDHTYSVSGGYFNVTGTSDPTYDTGLYSGVGAANAVGGVNSLAATGFVADLSYLPFSHGAPWPYSTYNARIGIEYTKYLQLYGADNNFDGSGLGGIHNASGNNTTLLYAWIAF